MRLSIINAAAATALLLASGSEAADQPARPGTSKPGESSFEIIDKNRDGKISMDEARVNDALVKLFKGLDGDKDGSLSRAEFAAYDPAAASKNL